MTPRARRAINEVCELMAGLGHNVAPTMMPPSTGKQLDKVALRSLVWSKMAADYPYMSLPQIARETGGFHHTSVLHGIRRAPHWADWIQRNNPLKEQFECN